MGNVIPHVALGRGTSFLAAGKTKENGMIFFEEMDDRSVIFKKCHQECTVLSKIIIMNYRDPIMFVYEGCLVKTIRLAT